MARYTVHVPVRPADRAAALERAVFVRDGWSWGAFFYGPLWLLWHRHWIAGLLALVAVALLLAGVAALPVARAIPFGVLFLVAVLWGLEGASLRRLALRRAGYAEEGLVVGGDLDALEQRFFAEANDAASPPTIPQPQRSGTPAAAPWGAPIIGLFPDSRKPS